MKLKKFNYTRELLVMLLTVILALPIGLYFASSHTVDPETLSETEVVLGDFDKIECDGYSRKGLYRIKITVQENRTSKTYSGYKFPVQCNEIPMENIDLNMRVVGITILSLQIDGKTYLSLEEGLKRFNEGHRIFYTLIIAFPLWFLIRFFMKRIGFIRVAWR